MFNDIQRLLDVDRFSAHLIDEAKDIFSDKLSAKRRKILGDLLLNLKDHSEVEGRTEDKDWFEGKEVLETVLDVVWLPRAVVCNDSSLDLGCCGMVRSIVINSFDNHLCITQCTEMISKCLCHATFPFHGTFPFHSVYQEMIVCMSL